MPKRGVVFRKGAFRGSRQMRVKGGIDTFRFQKFLMRAAFDDLALLQYENLVCLTDGAQAVCDHEASAATQEGSQGPLNAGLG